MGISVDNRNALKQFGAGLGGLPFPLLADFFPHGKVSQDYDTFNDEGGTARRTVVIVDKEGVYMSDGGSGGGGGGGGSVGSTPGGTSAAATGKKITH